MLKILYENYTSIQTKKIHLCTYEVHCFLLACIRVLTLMLFGSSCPLKYTPPLFFFRGLDVQPKTLEKFAKNNDPESAAILEIIFREEITHVAAGLRWFTWVCNHSNPPMVKKNQHFGFKFTHVNCVMMNNA